VLGFCEYGNESSVSIGGGEFLNHLSDYERSLYAMELVRIANESFENVQIFRYLGMTYIKEF
jgi:hypothetical protein